MFYLDTQTNKRYTIGTPFTYGGRQYTKKGASHDTFISLGFQQVIPAQRPDDRFYIVSGPAADGTYTVSPRDLAQLKTKYKLETKQQAHNLIKGTDWYVIRLLELGAVDAPVPADISSYRAAVRSASDARCALIDASPNVEALRTLIISPSQLYNAQTETFSANPAALPEFPEVPNTGVYY